MARVGRLPARDAGRVMQEQRQVVEEHLIAQAGGAKRVGVVFVHGIGQQSESYTVREFGGPRLRWLQEWHKRRGLRLGVTSSDLTYGESLSGRRASRSSSRLPRAVRPRPGSLPRRGGRRV